MILEGTRKMNISELNRISKRSVVSAGARYTPGVDPNAPNLEIGYLMEAIHALGHGEALAQRLDRLVQEISATWTSAQATIEPHSAGAKLGLQGVLTKCRRLRNSRPKKSSTQIAVLASECTKQRDLLSRVEEVYRAEERTLGAQDAKQRRGVNGLDPLDSVRIKRQDIVKHIGAISDLRQFLASPAGKLIEDNCLLLIGTWGTGKTHLLCDVATNRIGRGAPTLLLLAKDFASGTDALSNLCSFTGLASSIDDLLRELNRFGLESRERSLLILDGINESDRIEWRKALRKLRSKMRQFPNVGLIVSCRHPFESTLFASKSINHYVVMNHQGFVDQEFDAQLEFFRFYKLPLPEVPLLAEEFSRPLALKIICESFSDLSVKARDRGFASLTSGQRGMTFVLERYVKRQGEEVEQRTGFSSDACWRLLKGVQGTSGLSGIAPLMATEIREYVTRQESLRLIRNLMPTERKRYARQVLVALTAVGILVEDLLWRPDSEGGSLEILRLPYQRFSDHLIARCLLAGLDTSNGVAGIRKSLKAGRPLGRVFEFDDQLNRYVMPGWAEALVVEFPERVKNLLPQHKRELFAYLPKGQRDLGAYFGPFIGGLFWRHPTAIGRDTDRLVGDYMTQTTSDGLRQIADALVALASKTGHPYSAARLYSNIARMPMNDRDLRWSEYLRANGSNTTMEKVVRWIESRPTKQYRSDVATALVEILSLGLTTVDRLLRDRITKCLVRIGECAPSELFGHTMRTLSFNDPYVPERMLAAVFGVTMSLWRVPGNDQFVAHLVGFTDGLVKAMFSPRARFRTHHALRRDYAIGIVRVATRVAPGAISARWRRHLGVPFRLIPSPFKRAALIKDSECQDGKSAIHMDFGNYTIGHLIRRRRNYDDKNPDYKNVRRQIEWRIANLGYSKDRFEAIDREIARDGFHREQRDGSRIDRYGKKYSWIAYYEMYGLRVARGNLGKVERDIPRPSDCDLDPSFPESAPAWTPAVGIPFPSRFRKPYRWLEKGQVPDLRPFLVESQIGTNIGPWAMLNGYLSIRSAKDHREIFTFIRGFIVRPKELDVFKQTYLDVAYPGNRQLPEVKGGHYTFAGEIPWSTKFTGRLNRSLRPVTADDIAFEEWAPRERKVKLKKAWARLYALMPYDDFRALLEELVRLPADDRAKSPYFAQCVNLVNAATAGLATEEQFDAKDFRRIPTAEEVGQGFWLKQDGQAAKGIRVEVPAWAYEWESYHSKLNDQGGAEVPSPSICWDLDLSYQKRSFDLCDNSGRKASLYRRNERGQGLIDFHGLYLREDLLRIYLQRSDRCLVWFMWGERQFNHDAIDNVRGDPDIQAVWDAHGHIHKALHEYIAPR